MKQVIDMGYIKAVPEINTYGSDSSSYDTVGITSNNILSR